MGYYPELNLLMVMRIVVAIPLYCGKMCHYDSLNKKLNSLQLGRDFWTEKISEKKKGGVTSQTQWKQNEKSGDEVTSSRKNIDLEIWVNLSYDS